MKTYGGAEVQIQVLTSALDGGYWVSFAPRPLYPKESVPARIK
jgi:hypothetical protein